MSIRPVDLQISIPQSGEVSRVHNATQTRPEVLNQQFAARLEKEAQYERQHVASSEKSEGSVINKDGSGKNDAKGKEKRRQDRRGGPKNEAALRALEDYKSGIIDILV